MNGDDARNDLLSALSGQRGAQWTAERLAQYWPSPDQSPVTARLDGPFVALAVYLAGIAADRVTLSFDEVADLVGRLPESVLDEAWWLAEGMPQCVGWESVAWQVASVDVAGRSVTWSRPELTRQAGYHAGWLPHWIQVKVASKDKASWHAGAVVEVVGERATLRLVDCTVVVWGRLLGEAPPPRPRDRVWLSATHSLMSVPTDPGTSQMVSIKVLSVTEEGEAVPLVDVWPDQMPPGFGLVADGATDDETASVGVTPTAAFAFEDPGVDFESLTDGERADAVRLIGEHLAAQLDAGEVPNLTDALWDVGERFGGSGDRWWNNGDIHDWLGNESEPLLWLFVEGSMIHVSEHMSLVDFGGVCLVGWNATDEDEWLFVARVDRNDVAQLTAIVQEGFWSGKDGSIDADVAFDRWEVYPPLDRKDFEASSG